MAPRIDPSVWLAPGSVVVGDVELGPDVSVWYGAVLRGDVHHIRVGARTNLQDQAVIHVSRDRHSCELGCEVTVGHRAVVHGCSVGDRVLVGIGAVVLDGARIGDEAMVGAGAVVPPGFEVPPGTLVVGVPAKIVRPLTPEEKSLNRQRALEYVENARLHSESQSVPL
ncbi:gamma carbonic anhydrase family protein [Myxococcota bacterium]|nr:gamma carbonic anhydrase family protein [Myxococcota bacterium]